MRTARASAGFTLLEILLALVLMALVMLGVWGVLAGAARVGHTADAVMAANENVRTTQQFLRRYVSMAAVQPWAKPGDERARVFRGDADSMQFVAPLPVQSGHAGLYLQSISIEKGDNGTLALWLAYRPYIGPRIAEAEPVRHLLLDDVQAGAFEYLAAGSPGGAGGWRSDWTSADALPLAVRIRLDPAWQARVPFPAMVIRLHAGSGVGMPAGGAR